jgi:hypothetical protein
VKKIISSSSGSRLDTWVGSLFAGIAQRVFGVSCSVGVGDRPRDCDGGNNTSPVMNSCTTLYDA